MFKYFKFYLNYFSINIKSIMVYDLDYLLGIFAMIIKSTVNFCMLLLLFYLTDNINGWTFEQMLLLYGLSTVSCALWHCFFIDIITIPIYIRTGEFDRFLLRPIDPLFQIMMETFDEDGWGELIFGVIILAISVGMNKVPVKYIVLLPIFCLCGCLIFAGISILCSSVAFYTVGHIDLTDNVMDFKEFAKYPFSIFGKGVKVLFTFIIPIGFSAYYPGLIVLNSDHPDKMFAYATVPISIVFYVVAWHWWHISLKKYNSSGH